MNELDLNFDFDADDFDIDLDLDIDEAIDTRYIKPKKLKDRLDGAIKFKYAKDLAENIKIEKDSRYYCVVNGSFIFGDFIEAFLVHNNAQAKRMIINTLSLSYDNILSLKLLMEKNYIRELDIIVSDYFFSHERQGLVKQMYRHLDIDNRFQLSVARTHMKTCIFETSGGKKIVIHGSSNLRSSDNIEQFMIEENEELFDFNLDFQNKIVEEFKTINKTVRGNNLWETIQ